VYDPLVGREPVSASCSRWTNESLETETNGLFQLVGVWRNGELQLFARYVWCSDHQLCFLV
jgi:hypothetical protein